MRQLRSALAALLLSATGLLASTAGAETLRWARSGDSLTLDPHAQNEEPTHTLAHHIYETLVFRLASGELVPSLAQTWRVLPDDPSVWEFKLRPEVTFHDGSAFSADDVVFSLERARQPTSNMKGVLSSVVSVTKVDDQTVYVKTDGPNPLLPNQLTNLFIMDKEWSEKNNATKVQYFANNEENYAVRHANGTGAFILESREPDVRTVLQRNDHYWGIGQVPLEVTRIVYTPIRSDATRIAALLSGEVDFVQDVPVQDLDRLGSTAGLRVTTGPENRTIFLSYDLASPALSSSNIEGRNPFADVQVRRAVNMAINRDAIQRVVMRGQSLPSGTVAPPFINGYPEALDTYTYDPTGARALLAEAGYPDGFSVTLNCPNDRYVNDEPICQAVVGMLGQVGIRLNLVSQSKSLHFPLVQKALADFYMLGWGVPPFDSEYIFSFLVHTREDTFGGWNASGFSDPDLDAKIESLSSETDVDKRNGTIADIWQVVQDQYLFVPLHVQMLAYAMKENLNIPVHPENQPHLKFVSFE